MRIVIQILFILLFINCTYGQTNRNISIVLGALNMPCDFQIGIGNKSCPVSSCLVPRPGYECLLGDYKIFYKNSNSCITTTCNKLTKPFIIIEGFDPSNEVGVDDLVPFFIDRSNTQFTTDLRCDGWDIVVLNLQNNNKEIEKNARLVQRLIWEINQEVASNGSKHRISALGISMGGLILRHALAQWETEYPNIDHRVENFVSFDTPHKGANIPLGLQQMANFVVGPYITVENQFNSLLPSVFNPKSFFSDLLVGMKGFWLYNPAANQMAANFAQPNLVRTAFLANQLLAGDYPKKTYNIATANGANGIRNDYLNSGDIFFDWSPGGCVIDETILGIRVRFCPIAISQTIRAMPGPITYQGSVGAVLGIGGATVGTGQVLGLGVQGSPLMGGMLNPNIDHSPGGTYRLDFLADLENSINNSNTDFQVKWVERLPVPCFCNFGGSGGLPPFFEYQNVTLIDRSVFVPQPFGRIRGNNYVFSFVPTLSALDINPTKTQDWFYNLRSIPGFPYPQPSPNAGLLNRYTPFNAIHHFDRSVGNKYNFTSNSRTLASGVNNDYIDGLRNNVNNTDHAVMANQNMANFLMEQISPDNLYIQNRTFPSDYTNTFEARGFIAIGDNVAPTSLKDKFYGTGPVIMNGNPNINFSVPAGSFVYYDNGFDSGNANMEVVANSLNSCYSKQAFTDNTLPQTGWRTLRYAGNEVASDVTPKVLPFQEKKYTKTIPQVAFVSEPIDFKSKFIKSGPFETITNQNIAEISPNPFIETAVFKFSVNKEGLYSLIILDQTGKQLISLMENKSLKQGTYEIDFNGSSLFAGIYLCKLIGGEKEFSLKAILLK